MSVFTSQLNASPSLHSAYVPINFKSKVFGLAQHTYMSLFDSDKKNVPVAMLPIYCRFLIVTYRHPHALYTSSRTYNSLVLSSVYPINHKFRPNCYLQFGLCLYSVVF